MLSTAIIPLIMALLTLGILVNAESLRGRPSATSPASSDFKAPWFCHGNDCPSYVESTVDGGIKVRQYDSLLWASTDVIAQNVGDANDIGFNRLFDYISGANAANAAINMTSPVLNYIQPGAGPNCNSTFTVSFFTPYGFQTEEGPPAPTSADVYIEKKPAVTVAVVEYSGFAQSSDITAAAAQLNEDIAASADIRVDPKADGNYFFAGYDSPYHLNNRHNEDWLPVVFTK